MNGSINSHRQLHRYWIIYSYKILKHYPVWGKFYFDRKSSRRSSSSPGVGESTSCRWHKNTYFNFCCSNWIYKIKNISFYKTILMISPSLVKISVVWIECTEDAVHLRCCYCEVVWNLHLWELYDMRCWPFLRSWNIIEWSSCSSRIK